MIYLLQIQTKDPSLQLKTEVDAATIGELQVKAKAMVKRNPQVKGMTYRIFKMPVKPCGMYDTLNAEMIKEDRAAA